MDIDTEGKFVTIETYEEELFDKLDKVYEYLSNNNIECEYGDCHKWCGSYKIYGSELIVKKELLTKEQLEYITNI